jgi:NADH-quinone oxidoreductase subunit G
MRRHQGICTGCATGCSIWVEENQDRVHRIKPRENREVNRWWICNDGRYGYPHVHDPDRIAGARRRSGSTVQELDFTGLAGRLRETLKQAGGRLGAVLSPFLTVEEAYLLATAVREVDAEAVLALGPVPVVGEDERFPGRFTIAAEKCPNRLGVEAILAHFTKGVTIFDEFLAKVDAGEIAGAWVSGGYRNSWIDEAAAEKFSRLEVLIVQDLFPSPLSQRATFELGGAAFPERDGSYVNRQHRLQSVGWAIRPPAGTRTEGSILWELSGRAGQFDAYAVLQELARKIPAFSAAVGRIPDIGIDLRLNQLA